MARSLNEQLKDHIKANLKKGYTSETLKWALINQGYSKSIIEKVFTEYKSERQETPKKAPKFKEKPVIKYKVYDQNNKLVSTEHKSLWRKFLELIGLR